MAKKQDKDLLRALRAGGVRDRVARVLAQATGSSSRRKQPKMVTRTVDNLKTASAELDRRVRGSNRSEAAKKAARTRKRNAAQRSGSGRAARSRAKSRSR
jgi:hypothetical protein